MRRLLFTHKNAGKNGDVNVISVTARRSRKWSVTYGIGSVTDFAAAGNLRGKGTEDNIQEVNIQE